MSSSMNRRNSITPKNPQGFEPPRSRNDKDLETNRLSLGLCCLLALQPANAAHLTPDVSSSCAVCTVSFRAKPHIKPIYAKRGRTAHAYSVGSGNHVSDVKTSLSNARIKATEYSLNARCLFTKVNFPQITMLPIKKLFVVK